MARRSAELVAVRPGRALRPRGGPREHRPAARRAAGGDTPGDDVRLRVRGGDAPLERPPGEPRPGARPPSPSRPSRATACGPPRLVRYPGLKEEYYLADHVIDDGGGGRARPRPRAAAGRRAPASRGDPLPPGRLHRPVRRGSRAPAGRARGADRGAAAHAGAAGRARGGAGDRARAPGRRAEPGGRRRSRGERRRHDEPGGRGPRGAGVHALRRPPRARSTGASSRRAGCAAWSAPRTSSWSRASGAPGPRCATPRSWST